MSGSTLGGRPREQRRGHAKNREGKREIMPAERIEDIDAAGEYLAILLRLRRRWLSGH